MEHEAKKRLEFKIIHKGVTEQFIVDVYNDDIDVTDVAFHSSTELAVAIDAAMMTYLKEIGQ